VSSEAAQSQTPDPPDAAPALSIVIPAYNEAQRLTPTLESIDRYAAGLDDTAVEIIVVDDGSADHTAAIAEQYPCSAISLRVFQCETNRGKGHAVRLGMGKAAGRIRLMCDADMATPIEELDKLTPWLEQGYDVVIGSRRMEESKLDPPETPIRRVMARLFRIFRRRILLRDIYDTQCGFKLFTAEAADRIFPLQQETGLAFDVEVLGLAERLGYRIKEIGVIWQHDKASTISPWRDALPTLLSLLRIARRLKNMN